MILLSELSRRRIRSINKVVRVNRAEAGKFFLKRTIIKISNLLFFEFVTFYFACSCRHKSRQRKR